MRELETTISEEEYVNANRLCGRLSEKAVIIHFLIALVLISIAVFGGSKARFISLGALFGGAIGDYVMRALVNPWLARSNYKNYPLIHKPFSIGLEANGVFFKAENGEALLSWENIVKWRENEELILLYSSPSIYQIIPKRLSAEGLDISVLTKLLQEKIGSAT